MTDYNKLREIKTGYVLSKEQVDKLSLEEQIARKKEMLKSREDIKRLKDLGEIY